MICLNKIPLFNDTCSLYTGGICHKEFLIFLDPKNCKVDIFDHCLKKMGNIKTENYQSITENKKECCFILTKENDKNNLYKTTYDFLEFDSIELHVPIQYKTNINDIYFDEKEMQIFITTDRFVYTVTKTGYFIKEIAAHTSKTSSIVTKNLNGCCTKQYTTLKQAFWYTAVGFCENLYIGYKEQDNMYLKILEDQNCPIDSICLGKNIRVVSIFICSNKLYLLIVKNNQYNYLYETDICCKKCNCQKCIPCLECCDEKECHHHCHRECCDNAAACLLESIALVETSLSHILNAEGEKIQKAIADDASICELLEINNSVKETIFNTTMLEHVLQQKMERALKIDECHKQDHCEK